MSTTKQKFTIAVEGNIGSGKSTVLAHLAQSPLCDIVVEPVESWKNYKGHNLLAMLYDDSKRWGFAFQANAQMTLAKLHNETTKSPIKVMERSIYSARYCFVENFYRNKIIQDVEYEILNDWFEMLSSQDSCQLDLIIYLRASPQTCLERIQTRDRSEETKIDLNYLEALHECHEEWLVKRTQTTCLPSILIIDANQAKERVYTDTNTHLENLVSC